MFSCFSGFFPCLFWRISAKGLYGKIWKQAKRVWWNPQPSFNTAKISKTSFSRQVPSTKILNPAEENTTLAIPCNFSGDFDELEVRVKSMMEKSQNEALSGNCKAHRCKVCGKEGRGSAIKDHIEANHLKGIIIHCNLCDKTFRSRNSFRTHKCFRQSIS